ncbi:MAG: hypothetical protein CMQ43_08500 [Gammaproteobacteria bacterium]|mgnify:CR=1 FL=1|nr:hypothetical protein [Gammaproteobacteria bacterium]|tara:strand:- start:2957 stop:3679 length:723 start_codon:yes stop_codon:yes gene_type:complete
MHHIRIHTRSIAARRRAVLAMLGCWLALAAPAWGLPGGEDAAARLLERLETDMAAGRFDEAMATAEALQPAALEGPDRARAHQMIGFLHARRGDYATALANYAWSLEHPELLPAGLEGRLRYTVAQLEFALGRFEAALDQLEAWQALGSPDAGFGPYILMGQAYFKVRDYADAIRSLEAGVALARAEGAVVREDWLTLLHHLYVEQQRWGEAVGVLERLADLYPSDRYQAMLASAKARRG